MIRTRFKKVLLVAPEIFPDQLITDCAHVKHITAASGVFPSIYELNPDLIIFDHDFIGKELERMLRRIQVNKFYNKIKIRCFKNSASEKTDSFLKVLGVDEFVYREELLKESTKTKSVLHGIHSIVDASIVKWVINVTH